MSRDPIAFPESFNLAEHYLFARLDEGLGPKEAVRFGPRSYDYDAVARRARAFAALLRAADVRRGERVLIALTDMPPFAWTLFGTIARGAIVAMANPHAAPENLEYLIEYTRATALVTIPEVAARVHGALRSGRVKGELRHVWVAPDASSNDDPEASSEAALDALIANRRGSPVPFSDLGAALRPHFESGDGTTAKTHRDEPAMWLFTSGSTGEPKANVHAHGDFAFNTEVYAKATVGYQKGDVTVSVPRLFFGYATGTNLFFPFAVGATACLFSERPTPEVLADVLVRQKPTVVTNVPTMLGKLLDHDAERTARGEPGLDLSSVRFSLSAGEALPEALLRRWLARFGSEVYDGIGSAEMFHIYASNRPGDVRPGSLGRAVEGYELRILPEDAEGPGAAPCAPGEIGVLWVKGPSISMGYWLDRPKSFRTFVGAFCRTGDLFRVDGEGYLYFAGRADELLKVSGQWLSPLEVEECLVAHAAVSQAAVIGIEHEGLTKPKAFVVLRASFTGDRSGLVAELQEHVKTTLAHYKYPRFIDFVVDLPKNDRGKIDRKALRAQEAASKP